VSERNKTQVGIIGAGPAGLMLSHLLHQQGIASVVLELRSRDYVEKRVRAGVLEQGSVDLLLESGVGNRMKREGLVHEGIKLRFSGEEHRIDFRALTGKSITVYGQQEVVKDLIGQRLADHGDIRFEAEAIALEEVDGRTLIRYRCNEQEGVLQSDVVAGCDGSHGISQMALETPSPTLPTRGRELKVYERQWPFAWLGILARTPPATDELIYAHHERGFALHSMRTPEISRLYLQVPENESMDNWPQARIWEELKIRLSEPGLKPGEILESGITPMRSVVTEPMQRGNLFLAGDAAHIVPPTGAKGMNLALNDVRILADGLVDFFGSGSRTKLDQYSERCLQRVWRAEHFSAWMTGLLHRDPAGDPFEHKLRLSYLRYVTSSKAAATTLAENYVGFETPSATLPTRGRESWG
jgi:p-hydroxybenzoate 3-monooxygenase